MSQTYRKFLTDKYTLKFLSKDYAWVELPEDFRLPEKYVYVVRERDKDLLKIVVVGLGFDCYHSFIHNYNVGDDCTFKFITNYVTALIESCGKCVEEFTIS